MSIINKKDCLTDDIIKLGLIFVLQKKTEEAEAIFKQLYEKEKFHILGKDEYIDIVVSELELFSIYLKIFSIALGIKPFFGDK